jgi:hypothetical protein
LKEIEWHGSAQETVGDQIGKHSTLVIFSQKVQKNAALVQFPHSARKNGVLSFGRKPIRRQTFGRLRVKLTLQRHWVNVMFS